MVENKRCFACGRISDSDWKRKYCPITAQVIYAERIAEKCRFYKDKESKGGKASCSSKE